MANIGIIGGGISGLTLAFRLMKDGHIVTVWEASGRHGGVIGSHQQDGWLAEAGPNSIQDSDPSVGKLIEALDLQDRLIEASTEAKRRYIVRDHIPVLVPGSHLAAVTTPLLSWKAKFGVLAEPFRSASPQKFDNHGSTNATAAQQTSDETTDETSSDENNYSIRGSDDESLADFVRRRLGQEFLDYTINPMVGGIYAGNPERLSVKHAFPKVKALEDEFGSLIKGAIGRMWQLKKTGVKPHKKRILSFRNGLSELTNALADRIGENLLLNHPVVSVKQTDNGKFEVVSSGKGHKPQIVDKLIYAGTAWNLNTIDFGNLHGLPDPLLPIMTYAPVCSITLGYNRDNIEHPLDGFGILVPEIEKLNILGCLFTSSIFPNRAPENGVTLTTFIGGMRQSDLVNLDNDDLLKLVKSDLAKLLGAKGEPGFVYITKLRKAIPQYEVGFGGYLDRMENIESANPGFFFLGNYKNGISLDASIRHAWNFKFKDE